MRWYSKNTIESQYSSMSVVFIRLVTEVPDYAELRFLKNTLTSFLNRHLTFLLVCYDTASNDGSIIPYRVVMLSGACYPFSNIWKLVLDFSLPFKSLVEKAFDFVEFLTDALRLLGSNVRWFCWFILCGGWLEICGLISTDSFGYLWGLFYSRGLRKMKCTFSFSNFWISLRRLSIYSFFLYILITTLYNSRFELGNCSKKRILIINFPLSIALIRYIQFVKSDALDFRI